MVPRNRSRLGTVSGDLSPLTDSIGTVVACRVTANDLWGAPMRKALAIICVTLVAFVSALALPLVLRPATAQATTTPTWTERRVLELINVERVERGLVKLRFRASLIRAARAHTREMAERDLLTHVSENGWTPAPRVRYYGYSTVGCTSWTVGENLARGKAGTEYATPRAIVSMWMQSATHRAVLLTARLRDIGIGIARGDDGMRYFTADLGRRVE